MDALPQRPQEASGDAAASAAANGQGAPQSKETRGVFQAAPLQLPGRDRRGHLEAMPDWQLHRHYATDVTQYNTAFSFGACAWSPR